MRLNLSLSGFVGDGLESLEMHRLAKAPNLTILLLLSLIVSLLMLVDGVEIGEVRSFDDARRLLHPLQVARIVLFTLSRILARRHQGLLGF